MLCCVRMERHAYRFTLAVSSFLTCRRVTVGVRKYRMNIH